MERARATRECMRVYMKKKLASLYIFVGYALKF